MGRPVDTHKRAEIAARAFEVLREKGLVRTTMSELADALGMKRPTLYFYFKDPAEIVEAVYQETIDRAQAFIAGRVLTAAHPIDALIEYARALHAFHEGHESFIVSMFQLWASGGSGRDPRPIFARAKEAIDLFRRAAIDRLEQGIAGREIRPVDAAALVDLIRALGDGMLVHTVVGTFEAGPVLRLLRSLLEPLRVQPAGRPRGARKATKRKTAGRRT
jgi:AcrR family transcriptional regulator